jgi:hypothetical protein
MSKMTALALGGEAQPIIVTIGLGQRPAVVYWLSHAPSDTELRP